MGEHLQSRKPSHQLSFPSIQVVKSSTVLSGWSYGRGFSFVSGGR